ncbi:gnat family [Diaporthe eres]|nr:gnat family [Diaporthe eres]
MKATWSTLFLVPASAALSHVSSTVPSRFRNATIDDLDDITTVAIEAFKPSPLFNYIRQFADEVGEEYTWTCQREGYLALFQQHAAEYRFQVITVPEPTSLTGEKVVSVSVWDVSRTQHHRDDELSLISLSPLLGHSTSQTTHSSANYGHASGFNCSAHLDMNLTRIAHYQQYMEDAEHKYLAEPFGAQLYLGLLATHPSWDGNGFAARHLRWGKAQLELLRKQPGARLPMTLLATPAGYPLYIDEGFKGLKNVTMERLDGKGLFWHEAMSYEQLSGQLVEL